MDPTILQFLIGVLTGTGAGLIMVQKRGGRARISSKTAVVRSRPSPSATRAGSTTRTPRTGTARERSAAKPRNRPPELDATPSLGNPLIIATKPDTSISACPACGLEAPEALMAEHFQGSPFHRNGKTSEQSMVLEDLAAEDPSTTTEADEDARRSFRGLLQMLVPPRAFGHRRRQRTVNPLSKLIRPLDVPRIP